MQQRSIYVYSLYLDYRLCWYCEVVSLLDLVAASGKSADQGFLEQIIFACEATWWYAWLIYFFFFPVRLMNIPLKERWVKRSFYDSKDRKNFVKQSLLPISSNCFWAIVRTFPANGIVLYFYQNARCSRAVWMCQTPRVSRLSEQSTFPPIEPERERAPVQMHTEGDQGR